MKNRSDFWSSLDSMASGAGLLADWQASFEADFPLLLPFLKVTTRQAESYPCPARPPCGCRHLVRETDGTLMAICTCEPGECEPVRIEPKNLMVHALDRRELGNAICNALGFVDVAGAVYSTSCIQEIGSFGDAVDTPKRGLPTFPAAPVYLAFARYGALLIELEKLFATRPGPFVLLTPTQFACSAETNSALERHGCAHIPLSRLSGFPMVCRRDGTKGTAGGGDSLSASEEVRQLLAPFGKRLAEQRDSAEVLRKIQRDISAVRKQVTQLPRPEPGEPMPEDVARRAFALVQQLDPQSRMKTPSVLTVFRLYCMEEMAADRIARKCGCSKGTVISRLRLIRQKTGVDPEALRRLSPHLEKMEQDMADSRAEHIHRKRMIYDHDDGDSEADGT